MAGPGYIERFHPCHFFIPSMIENLLETVPMIIPFKDIENGLGLREVVQQVCRYLTSTLCDLLQSGKGQGGYERSWTVFLNRTGPRGNVLRSSPVSLVEAVLSIPWGECLTSKLTDQDEGFSGPWTRGSCQCGGVSSPTRYLDVSSSSRDDLQKLRMKRIFPLSDLVFAGAKVMGEELVKILLADQYQRNDCLPIQALKGPERPIGNLSDCRTVGELTREICDWRAFTYPHNHRPL